MRAFAVLAGLVVLGAAAAEPSRPSPLKPGPDFQSADVRALQADDFANPGMLWVAKGRDRFRAKGANGRRCADCHGEEGEALRGAATRFPKHDGALGRVTDLAGRIDACDRRHRGGAGLARESDALLELETFVANLSRGMALAVSPEGSARGAWEKGRDLYFTRIGQLNLACTHCHDARWGRTLLAEPISQGHPTGWPAYRLEWQAVGSLHRRLRACFFGVRAEQPAAGSDDLVALELYLATRAKGLPVEAPGVRR
ncbi:MAG TPA: sulfur oxidation c-type cytochrome SoxA [Usitatibacteraceae bacterium]|nr:sulfur oxidation c-type cytochrome SoxA [Usitatibacteraceae bacterium]